MPLTQLSIEVPGLGDNSKNLEVEGAIAVGEKVAVYVTGLPQNVSTSAKELRLRVLGPMGEDVATHGDWTEGDKAYTTTLDLASVQAFRLFFSPPPPPRPHVMPPIVPMRPPVPPQGYDPVAAATAMQPPNAVNVRLVLELRDKSGSDSDSDGELVDASLIGTSSIRLNYWPADWQTATLIDLANGRVYSKEEVDALIAEEARLRSTADGAEARSRMAGDATVLSQAKAYADEKDLAIDRKIDAKYSKPAGGIPKSDLASSVKDSLDIADELGASAIVGKESTDQYGTYVTLYRNGSQIPQGARLRFSGTVLADMDDLGGKADLVGGKVPSSQLPSYVDDVVEYASLSAFPTTGEAGKIYVALDTNKTYRWSGSEYIQVGGGGEIPVESVNGKTGAVVLDAEDVGAAPEQHSHESISSKNGVLSVSANNDVTATIDVAKEIFTARIAFGSLDVTIFFEDSVQSVAAGISDGIHFSILRKLGFDPQHDGFYEDCSAAFIGIVDGKANYGPFRGYWTTSNTVMSFDENGLYFISADFSGYGADIKVVHAGKKVVATVDQIPSLVQADWDESDSDDDSFIKHKPTAFPPASHNHTMSDITDYVPPVQAQADWDESDSDDPSYIQNKPAIPEPTPNVQADWDESDSDDDAFIKNKPTIPSPVDISGKADSASLAPAFSTSSTYAVGDYVTPEGLLYKCTTAHSGAWVAADFSSVAVTDEMGGGTPQVQSNWNQTDTTAVDYIKNKPDLSHYAQFQNDGFGGQAVSALTVGSRGSGARGQPSLSVGSNLIAASVNAFAHGQANTVTGQSAFAEGQGGTAYGFASHTAGRRAISAGGTGSTVGTAHDYAWVWNGAASQQEDTAYYHSHGNGTFNINPVPASGSTDPATGFYIGTKKLPEVIAENTNYLAYASTTTLAPETAVYRSALNADGTFPTVDATGIHTAAAFYQFELELTVPSTVPSTITGPSGWTWLDGHGLPDPADLSGGETICISVRLDCTARTFLASVWRVS